MTSLSVSQSFPDFIIMLLLNTLKIHFNLTPSYYCELLKTIEENLIAAPYSIHNIIQLGGQTKLAGE